MKLYQRMFLWALGVGIRQLHLSESQGWQLADHMRHFNHHLVKMRKCRPDQDGLFSRHLLSCSKILNKVAFEASLKGVDVDHDELTSIQNEINSYLVEIVNNDSTDFIPDRVADGIRQMGLSPD